MTRNVTRATSIAAALLAFVGASANADGGNWTTRFYEHRNCSVSGVLRSDGYHFALNYSWTESKQTVEFSVTEMSGATGGKEKLAIESPSLAAPWFPAVGLTTYQSGPEADAFRKDLGAGAPWRLSITPKKKKVLAIDAPPSNSRTQFAMFEACLATTAKFPNITTESNAPPLHWDVTAEASSCRARTGYPVAKTSVELLFNAQREDIGVIAWIADEQAGPTMTIDLSAIGGPRPQVGRQTQFTLDGAARAALLDKVGSAMGVVVVRDAAGASTSAPLVPPQDVVDFAMFRACVAALEPVSP